MSLATPQRRRGPKIASIEAITLADLQNRTEPDGDCLVWLGYADKAGSPHWRIGGRVWPVRRLLWQLTRGAIPRKHQLSTTCDTPHCVHPDHLRTRTRAQASKGVLRSEFTKRRIATTKRHAAGAVVTAAKASAIRSASGPLSAIATQHGVSISHAWRIRRGQAWRDYSNPFAGLLGVQR